MAVVADPNILRGNADDFTRKCRRLYEEMSGHHPAVPPRHPQGLEAVDAVNTG
jgi:hypothetical protein